MGCEVTPWVAREENGWALELDDLKRAIQPNTRLVVINLPHNPTGYLMPKEDFLEVNRIAQESGLILFSDEVYRESEYSPEDRLPAACDLNPTAVSLGVTSKTYGLPGLRIGWIATQQAELYERMAGLKDYTTICNSAPSEFLAELALRHREHLARRSVELIRSNLALAEAFFERHADRFNWVRPKAGPIAFPRLVGEDVDTFCRELVIQANVLLLPGSLYDDQDNHFRIGLGRANFPEALGRLEEFIESLKL
jgi:aspartate/methionine/tyrosine aminotransferase